jgi:uncharacterized membrane protein
MAEKINDQPEEKGEPQINPIPSQNSQITLVDIVNVISDRVDPIIQLIKTITEKNLASRESEAKFKIHMAWVAVVVVGIIVGVSTMLTWLGKMDGSTFGFLLGLVIGYALTFIRDALRPKVD